MALILDELVGSGADDLRKAVLKGPQRDAWEPTEDQLDQYMQGECHILAIALHRRLGWRMAAIVDWSDMYSEENPSVAHVMLEVPGEANLCIDINGWTSSIYLTDDVFFDLQDPETIWGLSEADVMEWSGDDGQHPLCEVRTEDLEEADRIASHLIRGLGLEEYDRQNTVEALKP